MYFNERINLTESKADQLALVNAVGEDLAQQFFDNRQNFEAPYNNLYYWVKRDPQELQNFLDEYRPAWMTRMLDSAEQDPGIDILYQDKTWLVCRVNTYEAAAKYGKNTRWCICGTRTYKSGKTGRQYFDQYQDSGAEIYFYISSRYGKFALCAIGGSFCQIFDAQDRTVSEIPNAPSIPQLDRYEVVILARLYDGDAWTIDKPLNMAFSGQYLLEKKGDEEEGYKYVTSYKSYMDSTGEWLSEEEFAEQSEEYEEIDKILHYLIQGRGRR